VLKAIKKIIGSCCVVFDEAPIRYLLFNELFKFCLVHFHVLHF
jgi:hypothetical protein